MRARMLYDHAADPKVNRNIAELAHNRELVDRLSRMLSSTDTVCAVVSP